MLHAGRKERGPGGPVWEASPSSPIPGILLGVWSRRWNGLEGHRAGVWRATDHVVPLRGGRDLTGGAEGRMGLLF